jgi:hypothetical protein
VITRATPKYSRYSLLLPETFVVNVPECWQFHDITHRYKQMLHCRFNFIMFVIVGIYRNCRAVPALYVHCFARYIISVLHNLVKFVQLAMLWMQHLWTVQYKSSQQFILTPSTGHQCVPFCDYSEVQAKCRLNTALHFNPQPTHIIATKYRYTIQLHIQSVDTAI